MGLVRRKTKDWYYTNDLNVFGAQEMPLSEILAIDSANKVTGGDAHHWFEIRTANVDFFVGDETQV